MNNGSVFWVPCFQNGSPTCIQTIDSDGFQTKDTCMKPANLNMAQQNCSNYPPPVPENYQLPCCYTSGYVSLSQTWKDQKEYRL